MKHISLLSVVVASLIYVNDSHAELASKYIAACPTLPTLATDEKPKKEKEKPVDERTLKVLKKVNELNKAEDFTAAKEQLLPLFEKIEKKPFDLAQASILMAYVLSQLEDYAGAAEYTEKAIATGALKQDDTSNSYHNLVSLYVQAGANDKALKAIDQYFSTASNPLPDMYIVKGNLFYQEQQYEQAICPLYYGYSRHPAPKSEWLAMLINTHTQLADWDGAIALQQQLNAKTPENADTVVQLANLYLRADKKEDAFKLLEKAEADGVLSNEKDIKNLAALYWNNVQYDRTAMTLEKAINAGKLKNTDTNWKNVAQAWKQHGDIQKSAIAFAKGGEISSVGELHLLSGERYAELNKWDESIAQYQKALTKGGLDKNEGHTYLTLAYAQFRVSKFKEALKNAQKAATYPNEKKTAEAMIKQIQGQLK